MRKGLAVTIAVGLFVVPVSSPVLAGPTPTAAGKATFARGGQVQKSYWAWGPYGRYWVPDSPPPPAYYVPPPRPYYAPPPRVRVWVPRHWDGYRWVPGYWRYE